MSNDYLVVNVKDKERSLTANGLVDHGHGGWRRCGD